MGKASTEQHRKETLRRVKELPRAKMNIKQFTERTKKKLKKTPIKDWPLKDIEELSKESAEHLKEFKDVLKMVDEYKKGHRRGGSVKRSRGMGAALRGGGMVTKG